MGTVERLLRVQRGEGRTAALTVALLCVASAGQTLGESGVTALFLDHLGADALPLMYLGQGAAGLVAMLVLTGWLARTDARRAYVAMPLLLASLVLVERVVLATGAGWIYPVLWLTVALAQLLQAVFLWGTAGLVTDTRSAKRLFPLFAAGGILGAVLGGLLTKAVAGAIGTPNLLFVWIVTLVASAVLCAVLIGARRVARRPRAGLRRRREPVWSDVARGLAYVRRSPLLVWLTVAGVLFSVLFFSLYLPFAQAASDRFADPAELAGFLGLVWAAVTAIAFVTSVFGANRLLGWLGAATMVLILPILYGASFAVLLITSTLATLTVVRTVVSVWLQGVTSPAWETLVNVVPATHRDQVRAFLNGGPTQVGTAIAGLVALVGQRILTARQLTITGLVVAIATIVVATRIRRSYAGALIDALRAGRPTVFGNAAIEGIPAVLEPDAQALDLAVQVSTDADTRMRRLAADLLTRAPADDAAANEVLGRLTRDEDATVRALAVGAIGRSPAGSDAVRAGLLDADPGVRAAALGALRGRDDAAMWAATLLEDPEPSVASTACVIALADPSKTDAAARLGALVAAPDPEVRIEALRALAGAPAEIAAELLGSALEDEVPAARVQALRSLGAAAPEAAVGPALRALEEGSPMREAALDVLAGSTVPGVGERLSDVVRSGSASALADHAVALAIAPDGPAVALLRDAIVHRARGRGLVALSAVSLLGGDREAMWTALDNLDTADPTQLANALETLEAGEQRALARPLLALWERQPSPAVPASDGWRSALAEDPDPLIRACVELVRTTEPRGDAMSNAHASMTPMERVLVLRTIALFADLSPADLRSIAEIAEERAFAAGEVLAVEGETGDELHIILEGTVEVIVGPAGEADPVARRGPGEVVGEMSIISRAPRVASLVAEGDVRTLRIGNREFESMLRERPEVSLAVMRVLVERLRVATVDR